MLGCPYGGNYEGQVAGVARNIVQLHKVSKHKVIEYYKNGAGEAEQEGWVRAVAPLTVQAPNRVT